MIIQKDLTGARRREAATDEQMGGKIHKVDTLEAKQIVLRDDKGRMRIKMDCKGSGPDITIYGRDECAVAIFGMFDESIAVGQGRCLPTPTFYLSVRDEAENEVFSIQTEVQNGRILPVLYLSKGESRVQHQDMVRFPAAHLHAALGPGEKWNEDES